MLFFVVCACFALFPEAVLSGAQSGLALCINAVVPSLLPFMLVSSCIIRSNFSRPLGAALSKVLTPLTGVSSAGCVCLVTGLVGGYGAGARAVLESYREGHVSKAEAERLIAFCNNAGPLFIIGTVGIGFFSSKSIGIMLFLVQALTALICARMLGGNFKGKSRTIQKEWEYYKKNKPPLGELVTKAAVESGSAIVTACVFVITFSAILEVIPMGSHSLLAGILEVTRGCSEASRMGGDSLSVISAFLAWGGMSVHFQANALCSGEFRMKIYYMGKILASIIAFSLTKLVSGDIYIMLFAAVIIVSLLLIGFILKAFLKQPRQSVCRQRQRS